MADLNYILAPWLATDTGDAKSWDTPYPGYTPGRLDLGSIPDCSTNPAETDQRPWGFFCIDPTRTIDQEHALIDRGDCREITFTARHRDVIESVLGVDLPYEGQTLAAAWFAGFLRYGSDDGVDSWRFPSLTSAGSIELHLGGHSRIATARFVPGGPLTQRVEQFYRHELRKVTEQARSALKALRTAEQQARRKRDSGQADRLAKQAAKRTTLPQRFLGALCRKLYGRWSDGRFRNLLTPHEAEFAPIQPETSISEDMSSMSAWTAYSSQWASNGSAIRRYQSGDGTAWRSMVHDTTLSSDDHYADDYVITENSKLSGACARHSGAAETYYAGILYSARVYGIKVVTGTHTVLYTGAINSGAVPRWVGIEPDGSSIQTRKDQADYGSPVTDTAISGSTNVGCCQQINDNAYIHDEFEAADLYVTESRNKFMLMPF